MTTAAILGLFNIMLAIYAAKIAIGLEDASAKAGLIQICIIVATAVALAWHQALRLFGMLSKLKAHRRPGYIWETPATADEKKQRQPAMVN